ncbi:uncharacterized protein RB166_006066 [Leptodactylus fuscus]|uniref:uncharacterized protein LOC142200234 n=1 Tax=Leptodactylus fuscus TaxID=238119 RepID=UPI003F4E9356
MEKLESLSKKCNFEYKVLSSDNLASIWQDLYTQCEQANSKIENRICSTKEKQVFRNIASLVKIFNDMVTEKKLSISMHKSVQTDEKSQYVDKEHHVAVMAIDGEEQMIQETKLKLKSQEYLMNLSKPIPTYDVKIHVCRNSEIFESHAEKFDLNIEQRNKLFKLWLPIDFTERLSAKMSYDNESDEWLKDSDVERLKKLIWCTRGDSMPTSDILNEIKIGRKECTYAFMSKFERTYKTVIQKVNSSSMVKSFVKKFKFLDAVTLASASDKKTLFEAASLLDMARRHQKHMSNVNRVCPKQKAKPIKRHLSNHVKVSPIYRRESDKIYEKRRKLHVAYKPYAMQENPQIEIPLLTEIKELQPAKSIEYLQKNVSGNVPVVSKMSDLPSNQEEFELPNIFRKRASLAFSNDLVELLWDVIDRKVRGRV